MRILRIAQKLYPDTKGGGQYHVHAMSRDQAALGHDVTVLTTREDSTLPKYEERCGYTVVRVDSGVSIAGNEISPAVARFLWGADSGRFDVIHAHSHLYFSTNLAALKHRFGEIPLAITNHGLYSQSAPERVFAWYLNTLGRWTFNQADIVFCYTETEKERLQELGVRSRISVVPNGIDTRRFTPEGPRSELIEHDGPTVLFVGRLVEGKRPGDSIRAMPEVRNQYPDARLFLCGEGPLRSDLEELVHERGLLNAVHFLGQVPYDEMPAVYRSGDVLVLPSRAEGVPRVVLEAQASGTPVLVSNLEQLSNVLCESGRTFEVGNVNELSNSLLNLLEGPRDDVVANSYSWEKTVESTTEQLERIAPKQD